MRQTSPASGLELFTAPKTLSMFLLGGVALGVLGNAGFTTPAVGYILENGIDVVYLSQHGRYRGLLTRLVAQEVRRDSKIPHFSAPGVQAVLAARQR